MATKKASEKPVKQGSREGKAIIAGYFDPAVRRQLKLIGLAQGDREIQDMLGEALNDFFLKCNKKPIIPLKQRD